MTVADTPSVRKARGAFFTPAALCRYVVDWAITEPGQSVLEPSAGEAAFLLAAGERLRALGADGGRSRLDGVELHARSAQAAEQLLRAAGHGASVQVADFFTVEPVPVYDAVVGNPPFVRYQDFSGSARARSRRSALRAGVSLTNLASSWAAFTVHAAQFVKPGGRLGLVLPAELLSVNYAAEVRKYLLRRFGRVRLVMFAERVFPGVLEEVVLLLAEGSGPTGTFELLQVDDLAELGRFGGRASSWAPTYEDGKWTQALLPSDAAAAYSQATAMPAMATLHRWGETTLGMVTGANAFFALSPADAVSWQLRESDLLPLSPPGSRHLRGLSFTSATRRALGAAGSATWLFRPPGELDGPARRYVAHGEALGVHERYKCRIRRDWWRVPLVPPADLLLTYMNADTPRLTTNRAGVHHLNSVHGVYARPGISRLARDVLPLACLNTVALLGAETVGRAYGGGMLKLEPREADVWPVPAPDLVEALRPELAALRPRVVARLREGRILDAVQLVDSVVLGEGLSMPRKTIEVLEDARAQLSARRIARGGRGRTAT